MTPISVGKVELCGEIRYMAFVHGHGGKDFATAQECEDWLELMFPGVAVWWDNRERAGLRSGRAAASGGCVASASEPK